MQSAVLLTGGIDSAVLARMLASEHSGEKPIAIHYNVGRLSSQTELHFARRTAFSSGLPFEEADFSGLWKPLLGHFSIDAISLEFDSGISPGADAVANGFPVMLGAATFYAGSVGATELYCGLTQEQYREHSKNYAKWEKAMIPLLGVDRRPVSIKFPLGTMTKSDVVKLGVDMGIDFCQTWSCFLGFDTHDGNCRGCLERKKAFADAGVEDPTKYSDA